MDTSAHFQSLLKGFQSVALVRLDEKKKAHTPKLDHRITTQQTWEHGVIPAEE